MKKAVRKRETVTEAPYANARPTDFKQEFMKKVDAYLSATKHTPAQFVDLHGCVFNLCAIDEHEFAYTHLVSKMEEADTDGKKSLVRIGGYLDTSWVKEMKEGGVSVVMPDGSERKVECLKDLIN